MKQLILALMFMTSINAFASFIVVLPNEAGYDQYISYYWSDKTCAEAEKVASADAMTECTARTGSQESCVESNVRSEKKTKEIYVGTRCNIFCQINLRPSPVYKKVKGCEARAVILDLKK